MSVKFCDKNKKWIASYSKRHPMTCQAVTLRRQAKTKAEATRIERKLIVEVEKRIERKSSPTWQQALDDCYHAMRTSSLANSTVENYKINLEAHTSHWSERSIGQITTDEIRSLVNLKLADKSESHRKSVLKFIRRVFSVQVEKAILQRNPCPVMKFRLGDKIKKVLTTKQVSLLLEKAKEMDSEWYPIWATALYTGMRNGELFALNWENVDLEQGFITVNQSWNNKDGFKSTKSGDDRILEIASPLLHVLKELQLKGEDRYFVLPRITQWKKGEQARALRGFLMGMGLPPVRFHDLRATWATALLGKGVEPIKVMAMGGWKDIETMMIYARKAGIDLKGVMEGFVLHDPRAKEGKVLELKTELNR